MISARWCAICRKRGYPSAACAMAAEPPAAAPEPEGGES